MTEEQVTERARALADYLELSEEDALNGFREETWGIYGIYGAIISYGREEYAVMTEDEADVAWDEALDNYIDDCMEIPDALLPYFDRKAWKRDARMDGRAHALSTYDGAEWDGHDSVTDTTFIIFRLN
jgi:hypothetical protein